jgi:subtilisin-like proprotein convertase family protein
MKYTYKKSASVFMYAVLALCASNASYAAETVCNDNGGAGWPIADGSITNISIPFTFGSVGVVHDVNVTTDINHTWIGDLTARVTSPDSGTQITLFERPGTAAPDSAPASVGPWGCNRNNIVVTFDDEAASGANIENLCPPANNGSYLPHNAAPNNLSVFDGEDPTGIWNFYLSDSANGDQGTLNQACITAEFSSIAFDKWVSTNNTCSDNLDTLSVTPGTEVYYCYTVSNPGSETFTINPGDTTDDHGHDLSALETTYVQYASQTVVIGPITAGGAALPDNTTTINNAQVTATFATANFTGNLVVNKSASLIVSLNPPIVPASGTKQLYFDGLNTTPDLTRVPPPLGTPTSRFLTSGASVTLNQANAFRAPFTITGATTATVNLRVNATGNPTRNVQVELFNGVTGSSIGVGTASWANTNWLTLAVPINIAAGGANFSVNDFIRIVITNTGGNNRDFLLSSSNGGIRSELQMQSSTVINVDNIDVFAAAYPATTQFSSYEPGSTVYVRATVSDPFGSADITSANITLTDATPAVQVNNAVMAVVDPSPTGATRIFEYAYVIPVSPEGFWDISITTDEGTEGSVSHTAQATLIVGTPNVTISKNSSVLSDPVNASNPKAIPNAIVEYTIGVESSGFGYVDINSIILTDPIAPGTTFYFGSPLNPATFIDGATASGLSFTFIDLASTVDDIDFSNDSGATYVTPTVDANGFDTTAPPINFIRLNPKGELRGSDGVNDPSMQINFRVRVE